MHYHAGRISQCPACQGRYGSREIVTTFGTSVAASIAVLTSAIMKRLDEQERRLLIFSNRQQKGQPRSVAGLSQKSAASGRQCQGG